MGTPAEFADVLDLSKYPNVYMKLSGLNHFAKDAPLYPSTLPFTRRVIAEFGPERMVWGSGTPRIVDAHMKGYPGTDIAKVKGQNLKALLNW
jgi:predicted TIM-barrel fold metal-dependent hydrolase